MNCEPAASPPNHASCERHGRDAVPATPALRGSGAGGDKEHPARFTTPDDGRGQKRRERLARETREALEAAGQLVLAVGRDPGAEVFD